MTSGGVSENVCSCTGATDKMTSLNTQISAKMENYENEYESLSTLSFLILSMSI